MKNFRIIIKRILAVIGFNLTFLAVYQFNGQTINCAEQKFKMDK